MSNDLSGVLPSNFGRADGSTIHLDLSNNNFEGAIPTTWISRFVKVNVFDLSGNQLTGAAGNDWISSWINALEFVDTGAFQLGLFSLENNQICYGSTPALDNNELRPVADDNSFTTGDFTDGGIFLSRNTNGGAGGVFRLANQNCGRGQSYYETAAPPVTDVRVTYSELEGESGRMVTINWVLGSADGMDFRADNYVLELLSDRSEAALSLDNGCFPKDDSGATTRMLTALQLTINPFGLFPSAANTAIKLNSGLATNSDFFLGQGTGEIEVTDSSIAVDLEWVLELFDFDTAQQCYDFFQNFFTIANIMPVNQETAGELRNFFMGASSLRRTPLQEDPDTITGWRVFNVTTDGAAKDVSQLALDIGVPEGQRIFSWDAPNQAWVAHSTVGSSGALAEGTAVTFQEGLALEEDLRTAGVSRVDEDVVVTLYPFWNAMAPELIDVDIDGDADDFDDRSQAATLFDDSLIDCQAFQGVQAISAYDFLTESWRLFLTCLGSVSVPGYGQLSEIDRADSLYVFFQSTLPTPITWDPATQQYTAN